MNDLLAFLPAQLDEDERVARAARSEHGSSGRWTLGGDAGDDVRPDDPGGNDWVAVGPWGTGLGDGTAEHIARWDPSRVLAEVEAKRRILARHAPDIERPSPLGTLCRYCSPGSAQVRWPCADMLDVVQPYAGRTGWREEWRV